LARGELRGAQLARGRLGRMQMASLPCRSWLVAGSFIQSQPVADSCSQLQTVTGGPASDEPPEPPERQRPVDWGRRGQAQFAGRNRSLLRAGR